MSQRVGKNRAGPTRAQALIQPRIAWRSGMPRMLNEPIGSVNTILMISGTDVSKCSTPRIVSPRRRKGIMRAYWKGVNTSETPLVIALLHLNDHERIRAMIGLVPIWGQVEDTRPMMTARVTNSGETPSFNSRKTGSRTLFRQRRTGQMVRFASEFSVIPSH